MKAAYTYCFFVWFLLIQLQSNAQVTKDSLIVPTILNPNSETRNDVFKPVYTGAKNIKKYHLAIYNRWGEVVAESSSYDFAWDGKNPKGASCEPGAYFYIIDITTTTTSFTNKGYVQLIR